MELRDPEQWIDEHQSELAEISRRHGSYEHIVVGLAVLILHGYSDEEILGDVGERMLVWDGQRSPTAGIEDLLADLRRAVVEA